MSGRDDESCDIMRHHAIGSGRGSGAGGVRCHSTEGVAEERRGGGSGSGRQAGVGSGRGSPYIDSLYYFIYSQLHIVMKLLCSVKRVFHLGFARSVSFHHTGRISQVSR